MILDFDELHCKVNTLNRTGFLIFDKQMLFIF